MDERILPPRNELNKSDFGYIADMLQELHALKEGSMMGNDAWDYAKTLLLINDSMGDNQKLKIDMRLPFPTVNLISED